MSTFWIICTVLLLVALLFVVLPLWRSGIKTNNVARDAANLAILRDQSAELEKDFANGLLTQDAYEQGKRELEARLLEEVKTTEEVPVLRNPAKALALVLAVLVPLSSVLLYRQLGSSQGLLYEPQQQVAGGAPMQQTMTMEQLEALKEDLKKRPKNPEGWWNMAQAYTELQRYPEALDAYKHLVELVPDDAQLWASYADVYAMANGRSLQGEVTKMLQKALSLDPENMTALALSGNSAMERGDFINAIRYWQKLLAMLQPGSKEHTMIMNSIQTAHQYVGQGQAKPLDNLAGVADAGLQPVSADPAAKAVTGTVSISPSMAAKASPDDTVFILARSVGEGRKPPLAVMRKKVSELPFNFTLDDSLAMQPQMRLSNFDEVVVVARVSKSGTPMAQPGDLQGMTGTIKTGSKDLKIVIDSVSQ